MALKEQLTSLIPLIAQDVKDKDSSSVLIQGNGRPDKPETTRFIVHGADGFDSYKNKITGREPNGTLYYSENGSGGVGAYLWQKQNNKWEVISADTGARRLSSTAKNIKSGYITHRRVNNTVECALTGGAWGSISFYGSANPKFTRKNHAKRMDITSYWAIPNGFRAEVSVMLPFYDDEGNHIGMVYVGNKGNYSSIELRFLGNVPTADLDYMRMPTITWITNDPFHDTLP